MVKDIFKFLGILWLGIIAVFGIIYVGMTYVQPRIVAMPYPYNVLVGTLIIGTLLGGVFYGVMWTLFPSKNTVKKDNNIDDTIKIPVINDDKLKLYVNGEYKGEVTEAQVYKIQIDVMKHIAKSGSASILDTFYFIGHKITNINEMGKEIKIIMDALGNLSYIPWEFEHCRRFTYKMSQLKNEIKSLK